MKQIEQINHIKQNFGYEKSKKSEKSEIGVGAAGMSASVKSIAAIAVLLIVLFAAVFAAGCTSTEQRAQVGADAGEKFSYTLTETGVLKLSDTDYAYTEGNVTYSDDGSVKVTQIVMNDGVNDVYSILAEPVDASAAKAAVVFAPGAGVTADSHLNRSIEYAKNGIIFMAVDVRGNGGKSAGIPLNIHNEYKTFELGVTPQYYKIIFDLCAAQKYLSGKYGQPLPIYAAGSSNGGRYACVAAAIDEGFAGYIGVSTSGYVHEEGQAGMGGFDLFVRSINPNTYIKSISPREVLILHCADDSIIPYDYGLGLYNLAGEPKDFEVFQGSHGINGNVDALILKTLGNMTASGSEISMQLHKPADLAN